MLVIKDHPKNDLCKNQQQDWITCDRIITVIYINVSLPHPWSGPSCFCRHGTAVQWPCPCHQKKCTFLQVWILRGVRYLLIFNQINCAAAWCSDNESRHQLPDDILWVMSGNAQSTRPRDDGSHLPQPSQVTQISWVLRHQGCQI